MSLPEFSIKRPVTVLMAVMVCLLLGFIAFTEIPVDLMPEVNYPTLSVTTDYEGVGPEEIETLISRPMEQIVSAAPGVERVTSTSSEGRSSVRIEFVFGTDIEVAADEVRSRLDRGRRSLPDEIEPPTIFKFDVTQFPIMFLTVATEEMDARELRMFTEKNILYRFERIKGVGQVRVGGGLRREIHIDLNLEKLRALDMSVAQVVNTVRDENLNRPVGPVKEGRFDVLLRTSGEFENVNQLLDVALTTRDGVPVYVRDIAEVDDSHPDIRHYVGVNGSPALRLIMFKQSGSNTVKVSDAVWEEVAEIHHDYPHIKIDKTMDTADFITAAIRNVQTAAAVGAVLAVVVLLLFLRSLSSTLIIGAAIPISVVSTFALMYFNGFTLNTVSFGGLALGVGMLVDNAIVVLENIYRHREEGTASRQAALVGSREVAMAITASTLTTIAVFVPVMFIGGYAAQTFQQLAYVVSFSLLCSLIVALTVVPALCSRRKGTASGGIRILRHAERAMSGLSRNYSELIRWALANRLVVTGAAVALFVCAIWLTGYIGVELEPQVDEGQIRINLESEPGTRAEVTKEIVDRMEAIVMRDVPEVDYIMTEAGSDSPFRSIATHIGELRITLVDQSQRDRTAREITNMLRPKLMAVAPGVQLRTRISSGNFGRRRGGGDNSDDRLQVTIRGYAPETTAALALQVRDAMLSVDGVEEAQVSRRPGSPEMLVRVDRLKAASMGMSVAEVAATLETAVGGRRSTFYREEGDEYDIVVRLREEDRLQLGQVGRIPLRTPSGDLIYANDVVRLNRQEGPVEINRVDQERIVYVTGTIGDRSLGEVIADLRVEVEQINRPDGYEIRFGGEWEDQQESFRQLTFAAILALLLVYMVMAAQFESLRDPFIILFSIPLAAIGIVTMLVITDTTFNMQGFLGVIVLVGIVVNNAIVLIDYTNQLRRDHGYGIMDSVITAGGRRLRPILMTTITTILGLTPMALGLGEGSELQVPMARVVIGGLLTSTLITLVFIPVVYATLEEIAEKLTRRRKGFVHEPLQPAEGD
ncbi:MAG: efflux RND transporter permease subunit [Bryobacterales bacterium]|nr:efflux RND transporter permease subunit [Bryobacterales bacterium]MDE0264549.1 efflux RND transporter permease subunit [Bryobacterales bacterium]MDE0624160.1 efflux RND transporter permease subunit [Bryobacterales bacterium]